MYKRKYGATAAGPALKKLKAQIRRNRAARSYRKVPASAPGPQAKIKGAIAAYGGRQELKYVDTALNAGTSVYDTTGLATPINLLAVGDDNTTRDGRQVTIKSVQIHGSAAPVDNITNPCVIRTMVVWDNANNSASPTSAQLIALLLTAAGATTFPLVDNQNRFTILWDNHAVIGPVNNTATQAIAGSPTIIPIEYYKKINQITQYSGTTAAIGSIQSGALWFITLGNQAAGAGALFDGHIRVRYTDN